MSSPPTSGAGEPGRRPGSAPPPAPDDAQPDRRREGNQPTAPAETAVRPPPGPARWVSRHPVASITALLSVVVGAFSGLWTRGALVIDGPGNALYVRLADEYVRTIGRVPYWVPEMWSGGPVWALAPSFPALLLVPFASVVGAEVAVKLAVLVFQVTGGVGAFVLARSIWGRTPANVVAAIAYTLHPFVVSHGALAGAETASGVLAAVPWLIWSLRLGLQGAGTRYLVASGFISAFAILHQAELAYGLALACALILVSELGRLRVEGSPVPARRLLARAAAVAGLAVALIAHWLLPFVALGRWFVLSPPELVAGELYNGIGASVAREIGIFFDRTDGISGTVSFTREGILGDFFFLGWVCAGLSVLTLVLVARRNDERTLVTVLLVALAGLWMSTAAVPLAASGPALREQWPALALTGAAAGLAVGAFIRRLGLRKGPLAASVGIGLGLLLAVPFVTPFLSLQTFVPLMASLRFPRFYALAPLGLALGTAYPIVHLARVAAGRPHWHAIRPAALAVVITVAFLVDVFPYRTFYELTPPPDDEAYEQMSATLEAAGGDFRLSAGTIDPRSIGELLDTGRHLSVGWPHPLAGAHNWRLSGEAYVGPFGYREAAYGLSATGHLAVEETSGRGTGDEEIASIRLIRNPRVLPIVRTYDQAVTVVDPDLSPLLATSLAPRNVTVVNGSPGAAEALGEMPVASVPGPDVCDPDGVQELGPLSGEVAVACALDPWLGAFFAGSTLVPLVEHQVGGIHHALSDGLRGIAVWLDGNPGQARITLYDLGDDGRTIGPVVATGQAVGVDEYDLTTFTFDPILDSAGRDLAFVVDCSACAPALATNAVTGPVRDGDTGNLILDGRLQVGQQVAFVPIHDRLPPASQPGTRAEAERPGPGEWRIQTAGAHPAVLVVAENYFPGWEARIDGEIAEVFEADGSFIGIALPPGEHLVTLVYKRPLAAVAGRVVTFGTIAALLLAWLRRRPRRSRRLPTSGDGLDVSAPPAEPDWESVLDPAQRAPRPPVTERERPGHEREEAVLAEVDDVEVRGREEPDKRRRPKP